MSTIIKSEETNELFAALAKMQGQLTGATKAKSGHGYKYADLAECINTAKEPLEKNGLAVTQMMGQQGDAVTLLTLLTHSSGQYIGSEFVMEKAILQGGAKGNPAQAMGASITYMRRYAYAAIIGLAQEDDDAANVGREVRGGGYQRGAQTQQAQQKTSATDAQVKKLMTFYGNQAKEERIAHMSNVLGRRIGSFKEITKQEASNIIDHWSKKAQEQKQ
jgi:hypothetical protein